MQSTSLLASVSLLLSLLPTDPTLALDSEPYIHDPSTVMECGGKYYTFGTGGGGLVSDDGWTWRRGGVRPGGGAAPDVIRIGDRYLVAYGATRGGLGGGHNGRILTMWNKTLDPQSTDFKYSEAVVVASSDGLEDCDAIDPAFLLDPTDGRLWLTYGTYFGFIRIVELDPQTGKRVEGNEPVNIAIDCEAAAMMYRDGWYYLLGTHGTCCDGANSTYNIRVGRSRILETSNMWSANQVFGRLSPVGFQGFYGARRGKREREWSGAFHAVEDRGWSEARLASI
jgi:arabinan endo-1,5-alpha-L-arabinosidase